MCALADNKPAVVIEREPELEEDKSHEPSGPRIRCPIEDDPGHTMTNVKLLSPSEVEITSKRNGKVVGVLHLSITPDGKSINGVFQNKETNTSSSYELQKLQ